MVYEQYQMIEEVITKYSGAAAYYTGGGGMIMMGGEGCYAMIDFDVLGDVVKIILTGLASQQEGWYYCNFIEPFAFEVPKLMYVINTKE